MGQHTIQELQQWQALPLNVKVLMTKRRIRDWVNEYGVDGVYVSFSGGKDSTVLLHMVREEYPDVRGAFVDTGLEYPEIREFVKTFDNIDWLRPKMNFRQVIEKYGYPLISKEASECVYGARQYLKKLVEGGKVSYKYFYDKVTGEGKYAKEEADGGKENALRLSDMASEMAQSDPYTLNKRAAMLTGVFQVDWGKKKSGQIEKKYDKSQFSMEKYRFFLDAPFEISSMCCNVMKKSPAHEYTKKTGRNPMTAQMACESRLRTQKWLANGCNAFNLKIPTSNPMAFWTDQDVLLYIKQHNLPICSVYGEIVTEDERDGQLNINDIAGFELFDLGNPVLHTTGCNRTGCMFCGYGCHLEKPGDGRFEMMKKTHPKQYDYIMRPKEEGGLNYKEIIDWINEHGGLNIRY